MLCYNLQDFNRSFDDLLVGPHVRLTSWAPRADLYKWHLGYDIVRKIYIHIEKYENDIHLHHTFSCPILLHVS